MRFCPLYLYSTDDLVITLILIKFRQPASIEILYKEPELPRIHQFTLDSGIMWIPFGLIGLMPISLLVFANPNQGILVKQSDIFDTTLQKVNARQSRITKCFKEFLF